MAINYWQHQGTVVNTGSTTAEQPNVLYEGGAKILSGTVFKMWFTTGAVSTPTGINYAESSDGLSWSLYSSNPVIASKWGARIYKVGSTYYLYCSSQVFATAISSYTSTDGVTWTLQQASALAVGSAGSWDATAIGQLSVIDIIGGTWYASYWGINTTSNAIYRVGLATSSDGLTWTKVAGNPVSSLSSGTGWVGSGGQFWQKINGIYYGWSQTTFTSFVRDAATANDLPRDLMRWSASNPLGPFTATNFASFYRTQESEGIVTSAASLNILANLEHGVVADPSLVSDGTNLWLFFTQSAAGDAGNSYTIGAAKIPSMTFSQLINTYEGVSGVPISGSPSINFGQIGSDNFHRADSNPIGGNWTQVTTASGYTTAQVKNNLFESSIAADNSDSYWNAIAFNSDQFSKILVSACADTGSYVGLGARYATGTPVTITGMRAYWNGPSGLGVAGTLSLQNSTAGAQPSPSKMVSFILSVGDELDLATVGGTAFLYWNGELILSIATALTGGSPGALVAPSSTGVQQASLSLWAGGNANVTPAYPSGGGSGSWLTVGLANSLRELRH